MTNKQTIDRFYKDVQSLDLKFPVADVQRATGYNKGTVSEYLQKKKEPSKKFMEKFYKEFSESLKKVPHETGGASIDMPKQPTMDTITILADTNQRLAIAHEKLADANLILAKNNERLVNATFPTADAHVKNEEEETAVLKTICDLVLKVGLDAGSWKSETEGRKVVRKIASDNAAYTIIDDKMIG